MRLQPYVGQGLDLLEKAKLVERDSYHESYGRALLYERDFFRVLTNGFYANSILFKHAAYSHEQEYRLLISGLREKILMSGVHLLRELKGEIVGYLNLPIPGWKSPGLLTHVRLGPGAPDELKDQLRIALATLGIPIPQIDKSDSFPTHALTTFEFQNSRLPDFPEDMTVMAAHQSWKNPPVGSLPPMVG